MDWVMFLLNMKHGMFNKACAKFYHVKLYHAKLYITIVDFMNYRRCLT
jgi:hypothetical protein